MKVCVTGGAGFIGSNLVDRLLDDGHDVTVLDNLSTGSRANLAQALPGIRLIEGDIRDSDVVADAVEGCEVVFHQAALAAVADSVERPIAVTDVNLGGTLKVLVAARDALVRRVVFASSSSVYGDSPELPKTESMPLRPLSPYAASKASGEAYLAAWEAAYGLETVSLRYFNVYGPRQSPRSLYAAAVPRFVEAIVGGRTPVIYGDGQQTRDFAWVGDVADALVRAATAPGLAEVGPINIGGGESITISTLVELIATAAGWHGSPRFEPARAGDVRHSLADIRRAGAALGWQPRTRVADGIAHLVSHAVAPTTKRSACRV
jgi:UDP-glucose 4-epimerase